MVEKCFEDIVLCFLFEDSPLLKMAVKNLIVYSIKCQQVRTRAIGKWTLHSGLTQYSELNNDERLSGET